MKNKYLNIIILAVAGFFLALNFAVENADARSNHTASKIFAVTPTPKKSPTPIAKATPKPTPKSAANVKTAKTPTKSNSIANIKIPPAKNEKSSNQNSTKTTANPKSSTAPKQTAATQIIVTATSIKVRQQPKANSAQVGIIKLGKILTVSDSNAAWYQVQYASGKSGWISKTVSKNYDAANRAQIYLELVEKYSKNKTPDFATATEVVDFLGTAQTAFNSNETQADLNFRRLRVLAAALKSVPFDKGEQPPYKTFLDAHQKEIVYSDPSGEWYVRSDVFWELREKYNALPIAEEIAWTASQNPIAGECEGYINCYLYNIRAADGEYLNFYPNGKYSRQALTNITNYLEPLVSDIKEKSVYMPPSDISDRAEFNRFLTELRTIISKVPILEKAKTLQQINQLGEGYK